MKIVDALVKKKKGMNKAEIVKITGISDGGSLTTILNELEASEFIRIFNMPGKTLRNKLYQLTDQFILFYNNFIMKKSGQDENSWINTLNTPSYNAWAGLSFEMVWLQHTTQLKKLLGISGIQTNTYAWSNDKAQIDLIFDRADKIIHLFEIKFSDKPYTITKKYEQDLMKKLNEFQNHNKTTKAIWLSLLTSHGLENMENAGMIHSVVGIDGLF